jgi:branched-chain amino acid transport system substrate-binding protein
MVGILGKALASVAARGTVPGVSDDRVVFGQSVGFDSVWGTVLRNYTEGLSAWLEHVNAAGGVHGRRIEVLRVEDHFHTHEALENVRRFGERQEVFGLVCMAGSEITQATLPLLERYRLPMVGTLTGTESLRRYHRYLFHTRAGFGAEIRKILQHLGDAGILRVALVHQDTAFGEGAVEIARRSAGEYKVELTAVISHPLEHWDAGAIAARLAEVQPQAVLLFTAPDTVADIGKAYRAAQAHALPGPWVLSVSSVPVLQEQLGPDARRIAITQVMPHPTSTSSQLAQSYRSLMSSRAKAPNMSYEAMEGYLTGRIVTEALRRAGRHLTAESFIEALESAGELKIDDLPVKYSREAHSGPSFVEVSIVGRRLTANPT